MQKPSKLNGKVALVTGSSKGLGLSLTTELIKHGATVIGVSRSESKAPNTDVLLSKLFIPFIADVTQTSDITKLFSFLNENSLNVDLFFLNAGLAGEAAIEKNGFDLNIHTQAINTNYFGVLNIVDEWLKHPQKNTPHFIVTNSVNTIWAPPKGSAYAASKAAIAKAFDGLSVSLFEKAKFSSVFCGPIKTDGLYGSAPFTWSTEKMSEYLLKFAEGRTKRRYPSVFYYILCRLLNALPYKFVTRLFNKTH